MLWVKQPDQNRNTSLSGSQEVLGVGGELCRVGWGLPISRWLPFLYWNLLGSSVAARNSGGPMEGEVAPSPQIFSAYRILKCDLGVSGLQKCDSVGPWWHKPFVRSWLLGMNWRLNIISEQVARVSRQSCFGAEATREALWGTGEIHAWWRFVLGEGVSLLPSRCCGTLWWLHSE